MSGRDILFVDRFDGPAGAPPDPALWWATPWASTADDDAEITYDPGNAYLDGRGHLVLVAKPAPPGSDRPWTAARVQTFREGGWPPPEVLASFDPPYRYEVHARMPPPAPGLWAWIGAAAVTQPPGALEIDVQEYRGAHPQEVASHLHGPAEWGHHVELPAGVDASQHVLGYWVECLPGSTRFGVTLPRGSGDIIVGEGPAVAASGPVAPRLAMLVGPPGTWGGDGGPPPAGEYRMVVSGVRAWRL